MIIDLLIHMIEDEQPSSILIDSKTYDELTVEFLERQGIKTDMDITIDKIMDVPITTLVYTNFRYLKVMK